MLRLILTIACLLSLVPSRSASASGYMVLGVGGHSCGAYVGASSDSNDRGVYYATWLAGYLTAVNVQLWMLSEPGPADTSADILEGTDVRGAMLWLENYCRAHPTTVFSDAAHHLEMHQLEQLTDQLKQSADATFEKLKARLDQLPSDKKKEAIDRLPSDTKKSLLERFPLLQKGE
jgi:hypothetical protein